MGRIKGMNFECAEEEEPAAAAKSCRCGCVAGDASAGCALSDGFTGSNAALVLVGWTGGACLPMGGIRGRRRLRRVGTKVVIAKKSAVVAACEWMEAAGVRRCGFDETQTTVAGLEGMRKAVSAQGAAGDVCGGGGAGGAAAGGEGRG